MADKKGLTVISTVSTKLSTGINRQLSIPCCTVIRSWAGQRPTSGWLASTGTLEDRSRFTGAWSWASHVEQDQRLVLTCRVAVEYDRVATK